uniref:Uncharacterized protein n=1 Tax=Romanomermis culicivorax TaxID=13658 RepID=A0A915I992_ROMCU
MWVLDVSKLTLCFPAALRYYNNPATSFLQSDVLAYAALDALPCSAQRGDTTHIVAPNDVGCPSSASRSNGSCYDSNCRATASSITAADDLTAPTGTATAPPTTLAPPTAPVDVHTPQAPSTSAPALDRQGNPIRKPSRYEHSTKHKQHHQEESGYRKSHKRRTTDEPSTRRTPPPSTSRAERGKTRQTT